MKNDKVQKMDRRTFLKAASLTAAATFITPPAVSAQSEAKEVKKDSGEKIDMFCHILPQKYKAALLRKANPSHSRYNAMNEAKPTLWDMDMRFRHMDAYEGLRQMLTLGMPPLEYGLSPKESVELARIANDEMAELVNKYPDRFVGAAASLPLNDPDASMFEIDRAIKELKLRGIQVFNSVNGKPLDRGEYMGIFEKMAQYDLPIFLHPARDLNVPEYPGEEFSKYDLAILLGWPYDTSVALARLALSGVMEKYPTTKIVTHHCGAMVPFLGGRLPKSSDQPYQFTKLTKPPLEYCRSFYGDTALSGNAAGLMCGYAFFGADHMAFATDYPMAGGSTPEVAVGGVIKSVEQMSITEEEKGRIFSKNARRLLKLS